jgi:nucleoside-triphosphatase THEP1
MGVASRRKKMTRRIIGLRVKKAARSGRRVAFDVVELLRDAF